MFILDLEGVVNTSVSTLVIIKVGTGPDSISVRVAVHTLFGPEVVILGSLGHGNLIQGPTGSQV